MIERVVSAMTAHPRHEVQAMSCTVMYNLSFKGPSGENHEERGVRDTRIKRIRETGGIERVSSIYGKFSRQTV